MELKQSTQDSIPKSSCCLNRTFYGIETCVQFPLSLSPSVLIVPFMELKLYY